jgi:hypothetical protein
MVPLHRPDLVLGTSRARVASTTKVNRHPRAGDDPRYVCSRVALDPRLRGESL